MKKRKVTAFIIGLTVWACLFFGILFRVKWLVYLVLGLLFGAAMVGSLVILVMGVVRMVKDRRAEKNGWDTDPHSQFVDNEENKAGAERMAGEISFEGNQWLNSFKTQTVGSTLFGLVFLAALVIVPMLGTYCFDLWWRRGLLGFCVGFGAVILSGLIIGAVCRNVTMRLAEKDKNATETVGCVVASSVVSRHQIQSGGDMHGSRKILRITYRVKLRINGKTAIGFSRNRYYKKGEKIAVRYNPKRSWRCYIINNH